MSWLTLVLNQRVEDAAVNGASLCLSKSTRFTLTAVSTPAEASLWILPAAPCWKSRLYTGSLLCQAISQVMTFILLSLGGSKIVLRHRSFSKDRRRLKIIGNELSIIAGKMNSTIIMKQEPCYPLKRHAVLGKDVNGGR